MNKRAAIEATKATALTAGALAVLISIIGLVVFLIAYHTAWGLLLIASVVAAGVWWMVYRDESR